MSRFDSSIGPRRRLDRRQPRARRRDGSQRWRNEPRNDLGPATTTMTDLLNRQKRQKKPNYCRPLVRSSNDGRNINVSAMLPILSSLPVVADENFFLQNFGPRTLFDTVTFILTWIYRKENRISECLPLLDGFRFESSTVFAKCTVFAVMYTSEQFFFCKIQRDR